MQSTIHAAAAAATSDPGERAAALLAIAADPLQDPLERVWAADRAAGAVRDLLDASVAQARSEGATWAAIGDVLGTSRQAAGMRFGWVKA